MSILQNLAMKALMAKIPKETQEKMNNAIEKVLKNKSPDQINEKDLEEILSALGLSGEELKKAKEMMKTMMPK
jgi:hypothetical protein